MSIFRTVINDAAMAAGPELDEALGQRARLFEVLARALHDGSVSSDDLPSGALELDIVPGWETHAVELVWCPDRQWRVLRDILSGASARHPLESPALSCFLPGLCRRLLGANLQLAGVPTLWLADSDSRRRLEADADRWLLLDDLGSDPVPLRQLATRPLLRADVARAPGRFTARMSWTFEPDRVRCRQLRSAVRPRQGAD